MAKKRSIKKIETRIKDGDLIDQRRGQLAEGAIKVFIAKGFHKATVREIAEAAGLTMGSMYNYVRSKEDIIYIVYTHISDILRTELNKVIDGVEGPRERLKAALKHNIESIDRYSDMIMFMYQSSGYLDRESLHEVLGRETEYIEMFESLLRQSLDGQNYSDFRLKLAADILAYLPVIVTLRRWSLRRRFKSMDQVLEGILEFALHGTEFIRTGRKGRTPMFLIGD